LVPDIRDRLAPYQVDTSAVDAEVLAFLVEQLREIMAGLSVAVAGDEMGVRHAAHSLMGIGGTAGFPSLSVAGEELSRAAKAGDFQRCGRAGGPDQ
jgi:HPt (histidine-containing phosphotransfer) domain-containing protein